MSIKHTAIILPGVVIVVISVYWLTEQRSQRRPMREMFNGIAIVALVAIASLLPLTFFQIVTPQRVGPHLMTEYSEQWGFISDVINPAMARPLPAGAYLGSVAAAYSHGLEGHVGFLLGEIRTHGWWYYYVVVGSYKVPIGLALLLALAILTLRWRCVERREWLVLIVVACWTAFLMSSSMSIGWRHFLVPYVFMLLWSTRVLATGRTWATVGAWLALGIGIAHAVASHPNYLSYLNRFS